MTQLQETRCCKKANINQTVGIYSLDVERFYRQIF